MAPLRAVAATLAATAALVALAGPPPGVFPAAAVLAVAAGLVALAPTEAARLVGGGGLLALVTAWCYLFGSALAAALGLAALTLAVIDALPRGHAMA